MTNDNAEILSAISMLSERIEKVESKIDRLASKGDRVELILSEVAKKLLAPAECRALGISDPRTGGGSIPPAEPLARAAKNR